MQPFNNRHQPVGIDDMAVYTPYLFLPIETLAQARGLEYDKLNKGLGLTAMAMPDVHEDAATMAADAVLDLILRNGLDPRSIGRIYLGTESAVDGAKPTASYVLDMLTRYFEPAYGADAFLNCDVVDLTFACIGAVDALQNTLEWVNNGHNRIGIVVASDLAKYELASGGEYTQGAGAVAMLVKQNPRLLAISPHWGVAARSVHDFFKPVRTVSKKQLIEEILQLSGADHVNVDDLLQKLGNSLKSKGVMDSTEDVIHIHKDTPVFDGPYSNQCYQNRIWEAMRHFCEVSGFPEDEPVTDRWRRIVLHLPYAFQGRRMFSEVFMIEAHRRGDWQKVEAELSEKRPSPIDFEDEKAYEEAYSEYLRAITKTPSYRKFVTEKIEKGERASSIVGNIYTGSIFLALMSTLEADYAEGNEMEGDAIGFFAYGSGSKSKVFEAVVQPGWREVTGRFSLMNTLAGRKEIDYTTYERLHRLQLKESVAPETGGFYLKKVTTEKGNQEGARAYDWREPEKVKVNGRRPAVGRSKRLSAVVSGQTLIKLVNY